MTAAKAALAGYWQCLTCDEHGETTATESSADVKHKDATGHSVMLGTDPEALARMRQLIAEDAETARQLRAARLALAAVRDVREARKAGS